MLSYSIPNTQILKQEISASHERCRRYGVNPNDKRNPHQKRLTPEKLNERVEQNSEFLDIATKQIGEL